MFEVLSVYLLIFSISFLAATILPLGSESTVVYYILMDYNVYVIVLVASVGNYLGALTNYYVGYLGEKTILSKYIKPEKKKMIEAKRYFDKYGVPILFFSWVPIVGDALTVFAGVVRSDIKKFTFFVFAGKFARYVVLAILIKSAIIG